MKNDAGFKIVFFKNHSDMAKYIEINKIEPERIKTYGEPNDNTEINFSSKTGEIYYMKAL
jgi:hypothetical protein